MNDQKLSSAAISVLEERKRQINAERWSEDHDDSHGDRGLAAAAMCYIQHYVGRAWVINGLADGGLVYTTEETPQEWPWAEAWWKPKSPRRDLERAAALIIAEIERLDRAELRKPD